jgi:hypothetical protein
MSTDELIKSIQDNTEWLETSEGDMVECISVENLEVILSLLLNTQLKISQE